VVEFADNWKHARAFDVKAWPGGEAEGDPITLRTESGDPIRFTVTAREPLELVRTDRGLAYQLASDQAATLLQLPEPPVTKPGETP
jgi:hypothetical protein